MWQSGTPLRGSLCSGRHFSSLVLWLWYDYFVWADCSYRGWRGDWWHARFEARGDKSTNPGEGSEGTCTDLRDGEKLWVYWHRYVLLTVLALDWGKFSRSTFGIDRQDELCLIEIHFGHIMSSVVVNLFAITVQYVAADLQIDVALSCVDVCEVFTSWLNLIYLI